MPKLVLFYKPSCPYCQKVLQFTNQNKISFELRDITDNAARANELITAGGKKQVPCLLIDGKALYESNDIIMWLKENAVKA